MTAYSNIPSDDSLRDAFCYNVYYDDQCEICQAGVAWLHTLDKRGVVNCVPIDADSLPPPLELEACLRVLHIVTADSRVLAGWNAVAALARLFPPTWLVGFIGSIPPFRWVASALYRYVAANRYALSRCR